MTIEGVRTNDKRTDGLVCSMPPSSVANQRSHGKPQMSSKMLPMVVYTIRWMDSRRR